LAGLEPATPFYRSNPLLRHSLLIEKRRLARQARREGLFVRDARLVRPFEVLAHPLGHWRWLRSNPLIRQPAIFSYFII